MTFGVVGSSRVQTPSLREFVTFVRREAVNAVFDRILPSLEGPRPALRYADRPSLLHRGLRKTVGERHVIYTALGFGVTSGCISLALGHYALFVGAKKFLERYRSYQERTPENPHGALHDIDPSFIDYARRHMMLWVRLLSWAYAMNVEFKGCEKIPDGPALYGASFHSGIFHNFLQTYADPFAIEMAEARNFTWNTIVQKLGASFTFDLAGLQYVDREDPKNLKLRQRLVTAMKTHQVRPLIFLERGRSRTTFDDAGNREQAVIYSCNPDPIKPKKFLVAGALVLAAMDLADTLQLPVNIALLAIRGGENISSKADEGPQFPFFGETRAFQDMTYEVVDVSRVLPGMTKGLKTMGARIEEVMREALGSDALLYQYLAGWGEKRNRENTLARLQERGPEDQKILLTIAGRILSIHPRYPQRFRFTDRLIQLIHAEGPPPAQALRELLVEVTKEAQAHEYEREAAPSAVRR